MISSFIKLCVFASVVLLIGQIPVGKQTLGARFQNVFETIWEISQDTMQSALKETGLKKKVRSITGTAPKKRPAQEHKPLTLTPPFPEKAPEEKITKADKESLMKILSADN